MVDHIISQIECFAKKNLAKSILIVSPLKAKSVAALQFQFYPYEYLPDTV